MNQKIKVNKVTKILSLLLFVALWYTAAFFINAPLILPYPHKVFASLIILIQKQRFWLSFCATVFRVALAFFISFVSGFFLGLFSADYPVVKNLISFPLAVIRATPVVAFILVALFWFSSTVVPVFVAVLMALPVVITGAESGFSKNAENQEKLFKASCAGFFGIKAFYYIRLKGAMPALASCADSAFGICWKVVAAGEVLSLPRNSAGTIMQRAQVHLETADVLAVTFVLIVTSILTQKLLSHFTKNYEKI